MRSQHSLSLETIAPSREAQRLRALHDLHVLDSPPEQLFDEVVEIAAAICGTPAAAISLLDQDRQWFKALKGLSRSTTPRSSAICNHLIDTQKLMVVPDTKQDLRFHSDPFIQDECRIRFYAGMPLNTAEGFTVGSLCVIDQVPRTLNKSQRAALEALGRQVVVQLELRANLQSLHSAIAQRKRAESALQEQTAMFNAFMDHSPAIGFIKDRDGRFMYYNQLFCERFAVSASEWLGKSVFDLFPHEFAQSYHADDLLVLSSGQSRVVEETSPGPGSTVLYWRTHKFVIKSSHGQAMLGGLCVDISTEKETVSRLHKSHESLELANERLAELSLTDSLTGVGNRRAFDNRLAEQLLSSKAAALVMLDLDNFKGLNDRYGHSFGDEVLQVVATLLKDECREQDCVARFGGEEFAVLLVGLGAECAVRIAERLRMAIEQHTWGRCPVTASFGVSLCSADAKAAQVIEEADKALYRAKQDGRNKVKVSWHS